MEILSLQNNYELALETAEEIIRKGGLIAVPTDTVYGIIGDAAGKDAINALYKLKQRPKEKAFPIFVRDIAMARWFAYISDAKARVLEHIWPGAITFVFHHKEKLPEDLTRGNDTIAMRMPKYPFLLALLARMNMPLVQSSANISGASSAKNAQEIAASFDGCVCKPDFIIDGGEVAGSASTIIDFKTNTSVLVRSGPMSVDDINGLCTKLSLS